MVKANGFWSVKVATPKVYCSWRATRGSNPGPLVPETNALSTELVAHNVTYADNGALSTTGA